MAQAGDGDGGIVDLVAADQARQRQVEQSGLVLIDHAAMFLAAEEILAEDEGRRAELVGAAQDHFARDLVLRPDHHRHAGLDDAGLLARDGGEVVAQKFDVIQADRLDRWSWRACGTTLVASYLPPSPTSSTMASAGWREKARNMAAAVISKKVMGAPSLTRSTSSSMAQSSSSEISSPAMRMRS